MSVLSVLLTPYFLFKLMAYMLWCLLGFRLFSRPHPLTRFLIPLKLLRGLLLALVRMGIGILVWWVIESKLHANFWDKYLLVKDGHFPKATVFWYGLVHALYWGVIYCMIRQKEERSDHAFWWMMGGTVISVATDLLPRPKWALSMLM